MIYNLQKLESFSRRAFKYETEKIIKTHHKIRDVITKHFDKQEIKNKYNLGDTPNLEFYLQGSYKNNTNVTKSSDVDLVVQMTTIWQADKQTLSKEDLEKYQSAYIDVHYNFSDFKRDIYSALAKEFDSHYLNFANKCIKLAEHGGLCDADIIPAYTYRKYGFFKSKTHQNYTEGMYFFTNTHEKIINFPKQHNQALIAKNQNTYGQFAETVRMFKNMKDDLIDRNIISDEIVKSYFIENLLYNVPNKYFNGTYTEKYKSIVRYLALEYDTNQLKYFNCGNGVDKLCSEKVWKRENIYQYLKVLVKIRDEAQF